MFSFYVKKGDDIIVSRMNEVSVGDKLMMDRVRENASTRGRPDLYSTKNIGCLIGNPFISTKVADSLDETDPTAVASAPIVTCVVTEHFYDKINETTRRKKRGKDVSFKSIPINH
jgi:hypothetical protein